MTQFSWCYDSADNVCLCVWVIKVASRSTSKTLTRHTLTLCVWVCLSSAACQLSHASVYFSWFYEAVCVLLCEMNNMIGLYMCVCVLAEERRELFLSVWEQRVFVSSWRKRIGKLTYAHTCANLGLWILHGLAVVIQLKKFDFQTFVATSEHVSILQVLSMVI